MPSLKAKRVTRIPQATRRQDGAKFSIAGLPGTTGDPQTPTAHAASHGNGQPDAVSLDAAQLASGVIALARIAGLTNAQIAAAAGIVYTKLTLTNSIVNADIAAGAAIAYAKLVLTNSLVNADVAAAAAIAYSKLALTGSVVNADVNAAAAIALSKILTGGEGITGTFTTVDLKTVTVTNGIVTGIA